MIIDYINNERVIEEKRVRIKDLFDVIDSEERDFTQVYSDGVLIDTCLDSDVRFI